ncbi:MAG: hypothetical protein J2P24_07655 [Streptosporangiales bacterium]|nr:hypothetical protein [Streptosporangiales bacterium]MBO0891326.1 hypothetical protein [Acidothermales bacterium]
MSERMWSLSLFRYDEGIDADEVDVLLDDGLEPMSRDDAVAYAHERGANLVAWWPARDDPRPSCVVSKVTLPLRWERLPDEPRPEVDERLWFEAGCGGRDLLVGNGHTFVGRMAAWCPHDEVGYNVSLGEMGEMSDAARHWIAGYLAGAEPGHPYVENEDGDLDRADMAAWESALRRFRRTGEWYGRWGTCRVCGCVLLPDTAGDRCAEHPW